MIGKDHPVLDPMERVGCMRAREGAPLEDLAGRLIMWEMGELHVGGTGRLKAAIWNIRRGDGKAEKEGPLLAGGGWGCSLEKR